MECCPTFLIHSWIRKLDQLNIWIAEDRLTCAWTCTMHLKERVEKRAEEKLVFPSLKPEKIDKPQKYEKLYQMKSDLKTACKNCQIQKTDLERTWGSAKWIEIIWEWDLIQFILKTHFYSNLLLQKPLSNKDKKILKWLCLSQKPLTQPSLSLAHLSLQSKAQPARLLHKSFKVMVFHLKAMSQSVFQLF